MSEAQDKGLILDYHNGDLKSWSVEKNKLLQKEAMHQRNISKENSGLSFLHRRRHRLAAF